MIWGIVRGFFYVWFSLVVGLAAAIGTLFALSAQGSTGGLPGEGWPLEVSWIAFILASLVFSQLGSFGKRVSLLKWIPICLVVTFAMAFGLASSL